MRFKRTLALVLSCFTLCSPSAYAATAEFTIDSDKFYVSDSGITKHDLEAAPYIENSRTMVPVRAVSESFGAEVSWDEASQKVIIKDKDITVELLIDSDIAYVNGEAVMLDSPAVINNNRTMIPLRFVSEALGKNVEYVATTKQILISDEQPVFTVNGIPVTVEDFRSYLYYGGYEYSDEDISQVVLQTTNTLLEGFVFSDEFKKNNLVAVPYASSGDVQTIMSLKDEIYKDVLVAPIIKIYEAIMDTSMYFEHAGFYPSEQEIIDYYNSNYVRAKHVLVLAENDADKKAAKKEAEKILALAKKGEDFDKLVESYGEDPGMAESPEGYVFTYGEMVPEFEKASFGLEEGEISDIVETAYGYHIIKKESLPELSGGDVAYLSEVIFSVKYGEKAEELFNTADVQVNYDLETLISKLKPVQ